MGRLGTPADIGNAEALLCSEEAGWITGQLIAVDGGAGLMDASLPLEIPQAVAQSAASQSMRPPNLVCQQQISISAFRSNLIVFFA
jgi:hypothetical protein